MHANGVVTRITEMTQSRISENCIQLINQKLMLARKNGVLEAFDKGNLEQYKLTHLTNT